MRFFALFTVLILGSCGSKPPVPAKKPLITYSHVLSLSGHGNAQTEAFNMESGQWRIKWVTTHEDPKGAGTFRVMVHSSVSGRPLSQAVDTKGEGHDIAYMSEDPRLFFLVIESKNLDWTIDVEEETTSDPAR